MSWAETAEPHCEIKTAIAMNRTNMKRCSILSCAVPLAPGVRHFYDSLLRKVSSLLKTGKTWEVSPTKVDASPLSGTRLVARRVVSNQSDGENGLFRTARESRLATPLFEVPTKVDLHV